MLTVDASPSSYYSSSPSSPGQTSTSSSDDLPSTTRHSSLPFSHMLHADLKTLSQHHNTMPDSSFHVPPEMKCQYKTGTCTNMRTTKKNGKLLMLCELHRKKQNEIKKRSDRKQSALRMNRRLEAKQKTMGGSMDRTIGHDAMKKQFKRTTPKFEELLACDPSQMWEHHATSHHHSSFDSSPSLTLPRVNVWRTKDGIATTGSSLPSMHGGYPPKSATTSISFQHPFSPNGQMFDWSLIPAAVMGNVTPRGNDLAILEFFLDD